MLKSKFIRRRSKSAGRGKAAGQSKSAAQPSLSSVQIIDPPKEFSNESSYPVAAGAATAAGVELGNSKDGERKNIKG